MSDLVGSSSSPDTIQRCEAELLRFYEENTFYVWGDLEFEMDGGEKKARKGKEARRHPYEMLQIVPQAMIGRCLSDSSGAPDYLPTFSTAGPYYVAQAQQFWMSL